MGRSKRTRNVLIFTAMGTGVGAAIGAGLYEQSSKEGFLAVLPLISAGIGAGAGAGVGAAIPPGSQTIYRARKKRAATAP